MEARKCGTSEKTQVSNYRPISLLCIVSKVMERYIYNNIFKVVEPLINKYQHRFLNGRFCTSQFLAVYGNLLDERVNTLI